MTALSARRATLPSGDVLGVVELPEWPPCLVLVDVSGSMGSAGVDRALAAANQILAELPPRRFAAAIAYAQRGVLSGLLAQSPRPTLRASALDQVGLRVTRDAAGWDLARRELARWRGREAPELAAEVVWISDFSSGPRKAPGVWVGDVHLLHTRGLEAPQGELPPLQISPAGELPPSLLPSLAQDPGALRIQLDHPARWFSWTQGALEHGPTGEHASLSPAAGSLAWVAAPHAKASVVREGAEVALGFAEGPPAPALLAAVREVSQ